MRHAFALAMILGCSSVFAQAPKLSKSSAAPVRKIVGYKFTKDTGEIVFIRFYEKVGKFYRLRSEGDGTFGSGRDFQLFETSVLKIEPLAEDAWDESKAQAASDTRVSEAGPNSARTTARTAVRTTAKVPSPEYAKTAARRKARSQAHREAADGGFVDQSGDAGYTATGIPMHVGPRGGVYHISSGGNKVYHKR